MTKKRPRIIGGQAKDGHIYTAKFTPDSWYEDMVREAFDKAYPSAKPIGWSCCTNKKIPKKHRWIKRKGVRDYQLPSVEMIFMFYFEGGKIGDLDNYIKAIKDALSKYAYVDDRQVKHYMPYLVTPHDMEGCGIDYDAEPTRVDIIVRNYSLAKDKYFLKLRRFFKKHAKVIDLTDEYYEE